MSCKVSHGGMERASMVLDLYGTAGGAAGSAGAAERTDGHRSGSSFVGVGRIGQRTRLRRAWWKVLEHYFDLRVLRLISLSLHAAEKGNIQDKTMPFRICYRR